MDALSQQRVAQLAGRAPDSWRRIVRGYTPAERWQVTFADGSTAFAKFGSTPKTAAWLRAERGVYAKLSGRFMPNVIGYDEHAERPLLLLEDLSGAWWPPPWRAGDVERLLDAMREVAATPLARGVLPELESERGRFAGWLHVERDPAAFLALGLCSPGWLEAALPSLLMAQDLALLGGSELVHGDLRSDNLCLAQGRVVLAHLACADPCALSAQSGEEAGWRWSRELILDALPEGTRTAHVLDVGCANGYLMESLQRWGKQRGLHIEPYGLDFSPRLTALAQRRLPAWADRIEVGNVLEHSPKRRHELVVRSFDYVPPARRRESIERIFQEHLAPGGRVVLRPERVRKGQPDLAEQAAALGLAVGGALARQHRTSGELLCGVWLAAR